MRSKWKTAAIVAVLAGASLLAGCAARPAPGDAEGLADYNERNDPLEPANRKFYAVNDAIDRNALRPAALGYRDVTPAPIRSHLHNVLANIGNPAQFTNDVLQGKPRKAGNTLMRLLINSTAGVGGVFDVASDWGYPDHDTDFGLTLALWGVPDGPFLFLPVLGPSNPRDGVGYGVNTTLDPLIWLSFGGSATLGYTRFTASALDGRERVLDQTDAIEKTALDPYATYRSLYQQHRQAAVDDARNDLPATVPIWYAKQPGTTLPAPASTVPPQVSPQLAPPNATKP